MKASSKDLRTREPGRRPFLPALADGLDPLTVHAEVRIAHSGCGPDMDDLCSVVNKELDIINEPEDGAGKLRVEVAVADSDYRRAWESLDDGRELFYGIGSPPGIGQGGDAVGIIRRLA